MMTCVRCGKEFSEEFRFCPYCGKKKETKTGLSDVKRALFWACCSQEDLLEEMKRLVQSNKSAGELAQYVRGPVESRKIWSICAECVDGYRTVKRRTVSLDWIAWETVRKKLVCAYPEECELSKGCVNKIGSTYFWTKDECQMAIDKALKEAAQDEA